MLTPEEDVEITSLSKRGWSISAIARHVGHDRLDSQPLIAHLDDVLGGQRAELAGARDHGGRCLRAAPEVDERSPAGHRCARTHEPDEDRVVAAREALQRIDLTTHRGEHPRVGATDVIPIIPIRHVTMDACVQIARQVGRRLADEAARLFQRHLIHDLGYHRLQLEIYGFNERAQRHAERAGFVKEGVRRKAYDRHGEWVDGVIYGLVREDLECSQVRNTPENR